MGRAPSAERGHAVLRWQTSRQWSGAGATHILRDRAVLSDALEVCGGGL